MTFDKYVRSAIAGGKILAKLTSRCTIPALVESI